MSKKKAKQSKTTVTAPITVKCKTDIKSLKVNYPHAWNMTSKEFHEDPEARLDVMMARAKDCETMRVFRRAICDNRHLFVGRNILVLNCATDFLLTLWALKQGAAHVYGVDTSYAMEYLRRIINTNNLIANVTLIRGRIEDIQLPVKEVDIIISNWIGYSLLFDSKIEAVLYARDKWLKKDTGIIFPDKALLYVAGIENSNNKNQHIDWWRDVNGFNMNAIRKLALKEPSYQTVNEKDLLTDPVLVWTIDLYTIKAKELQFRTPFTFEAQHCGCLEGVLTFFDVYFTKSHTTMFFSTSPWSKRTSWLQTVFYFDEPIPVNVGNKFYCGIDMRPCLGDCESKTYSVLVEVFTGMLHNLSKITKMIWRRTSVFGKPIEFIQPCTVLELKSESINTNTKETKKKEIDPSPPQGGKHSNVKNGEKKKRNMKNIPASIFFD